MQDTELFIELAGMAGVFVGFGARIAVRSGGASDAFEVAYVRGVVLMGLLAAAAARSLTFSLLPGTALPVDQPVATASARRNSLSGLSQRRQPVLAPSAAVQLSPG